VCAQRSALSEESACVLAQFARDTGSFRCTNAQARELAAAVSEALALLGVTP
jgi:hypothetical protein